MTSSNLVRLLLGLLAASEAIASPALSSRQGHNEPACKNPRQRRAWHTLSGEEKKAYIEAELCLMHKPAKLNLRGTRTRFDELQSCHILQAEITHNVGAFLPFHRLLMWAHEELLVQDCGYKGAQP
jgi:hypothetical protein